MFQELIPSKYAKCFRIHKNKRSSYFPRRICFVHKCECLRFYSKYLRELRIRVFGFFIYINTPVKGKISK